MDRVGSGEWGGWGARCCQSIDLEFLGAYTDECCRYRRERSDDHVDTLLATIDPRKLHPPFFCGLNTSLLG